jgi:hypothetical protein
LAPLIVPDGDEAQRTNVDVGSRVSCVDRTPILLSPAAIGRIGSLRFVALHPKRRHLGREQVDAEEHLNEVYFVVCSERLKHTSPVSS